MNDKRKLNTLELYGEDCKKFSSLNPSAKEVKSANIKIVVADEEYQSLRAGFVGTWKNKELMKINVIKIRNYLGDMTSPLKVRRVLNYLTGSAFRMGIINSLEISKLRDEVRMVWNNMLNSEN